MSRKILTPAIKVAAAMLRSNPELTQQDIAKRLNISQGAVSMALQWAREQHILIEKASVDEDKVSPDDLPLALKLAGRTGNLASTLRHQTAEVLRIHCPNAKRLEPARFHILPSSSRGTTTRHWRSRLEAFGAQCAQDKNLLTWLGKSKVTGISWGSTVGSLVYAVERYPAPHDCFVIPLCGEPLGASMNLTSSSTLAAALQRVLTGGRTEALSLAPVPALIPLDFTESEIAAIRKLNSRVQAYHRIFDELIHNMDCVICSVGPGDRVWGCGGDKLIESAGIPRERIASLVFGDIGGVLIPRPGNEGDVEKVCSHWTGIEKRHLVECSKRARENDQGGVIVLAIGANKAQFVFDCICQSDLVNHFFVDHDLATNLERITSKWLCERKVAG